MNNLIEKLKESKAIKEQSQKEKGGYGMLNTPHLPEVLGTQVYFAQTDFRDNLKAEHKAKMISEGWKALTRDIEYRGKIEFIANKSSDWFASRLADTGKLIDSVVSCDSVGNRHTELFLCQKRHKMVSTLDLARYNKLMCIHMI